MTWPIVRTRTNLVSVDFSKVSPRSKPPGPKQRAFLIGVRALRIGAFIGHWAYLIAGAVLIGCLLSPAIGSHPAPLSTLIDFLIWYEGSTTTTCGQPSMPV